MSCGALHNIEICKGRDFSQILKIDNGDGFLDLSGYTFKATMKDNVTVPTEAYEFKFETVAGDKSAIKIYLTDTDTAKMRAGVYYWDLLVTSPKGIDTNLLYGTVNILDSVTNKTDSFSEIDFNDGFRIY